MTPDCTFVLVARNAGVHLAPVLDSLASGAAGLSWEAVLVDNASADGAVERAARGRPWLRVLRSPRNLGYAGAAALGAASARGRHLFFLNPDTVLLNDAAARLVRYLDAHPRSGAAGPTLEDEQGRVQASARGVPGFRTILCHRRGLLTRFWPGNPWSRAYLAAGAGGGRPAWLSGAAVMVPRKVWLRVGPYDPAYFLYVEDVDYGRRLRAAGYDLALVPEARVLHRGGGAATRPPRRLRVLAHHRGMWRYCRAHLAGGTAVRGTVVGGLAWLGLLARCALHSVLAVPSAGMEGRA